MAAAADSAAVDKLFEGGLLLIWSYAHTGVLSKYRKEFPIGTFSLAKNIDNVTPPKIKIGQLTKYEQFLGVKCDSNQI